MAEILVSSVVEKLRSIMDREQKQEMRLVVCLKKAVDKMVWNLNDIQPLLADAERRQMNDDVVREWLEKLKDFAYDIEDVLDDWEAAILSSQTKPRDEQDPKKPESKVCSPLRSFYIFCKQVGLCRKLKKLRERLDGIAEEKYRHRIVQDIAEVVVGRQEAKDELVEKLLSEPSDGDGSDPRVLSIVGMGGVGKTTLAQFVFHDDRIQTHFDKRLWITVPDSFDETKFVEAIHESLFKSTPNVSRLEDLWEKIKKSINGKKIFFVLDDVRNDNFCVWPRFEQFLKSSSSKNKILLTTRIMGTAFMMNCLRDDILILEALSDSECWLIVAQAAFLGRSDVESKGLKVIGKEIAKKCRGLPLAAKAMGSLLRFRQTREEWQSILESQRWDVEETHRDHFSILWLSYGSLSPALKRCFSYCAIFPEDFVIDNRTLIELWMAQGYLKQGRSDDSEITGEIYLSELFSSSFFNVLERGKFDYCVIYSSVMHNVIHSLARFAARNECCHAQVGYPMELIKERHIAFTLSNRTSSLTFEGLKKVRSLLFLQSGRRSFLTTASLSRLFSEVTRVRSLSLRGFVFVEIPSSIRKLVQLRWLDLSYNGELKLLPETLCELHNLQTIDVSGCCGLELPGKIGQLIDLRHLHNSGGPSMLPKGIARLTGLRTLEEVDVGCDEEAFSLGDLKNLNQLRGRLEIRNLGAGSHHVGEATQAELTKKEHITYLVLRFCPMKEDEEKEKGGERRKPKNEEEEEEEERCTPRNEGGGEGERFTPRNEEEEEEEERCTPRNEGGGGGERFTPRNEEEERERCTPRNEKLLEALEPSPNLEILGIFGYEGTTFPGWMISLKNLRHLRLSDYYKSDHLPSLGKLPSLETLTLVGMSRVEKVGLVLLGIETRIGDSKSEISASSSSSSSPVAFPKLEKLQFSLMRSWEEWDDYCDRTTEPSPIIIMPSLRFLRIFDCPLLKALPDYILHNTMLETLQIGGSDLLRDRYNENGEDWSKISHIHHVKIYH